MPPTSATPTGGARPDGAAPRPRSHLYFADLDDRLYLRVVRNVAHDLVGVRREGLLEGVRRLEQQMSHGDEAGRCAGSAAGHALLDGDTLACRAELLPDHRHVLGHVVGHVEFG